MALPPQACCDRLDATHTPHGDDNAAAIGVILRQFDATHTPHGDDNIPFRAFYGCYPRDATHTPHGDDNVKM